MTACTYKTSSSNGAASQFDLNQTLTVDAETELTAMTEEDIVVARRIPDAIRFDRRIFQTVCAFS